MPSTETGTVRGWNRVLRFVEQRQNGVLVIPGARAAVTNGDGHYQPNDKYWWLYSLGLPRAMVTTNT